MDNKNAYPGYPPAAEYPHPPQPGFQPPPPSYSAEPPLLTQPSPVTVTTMNVIAVGPNPTNLVCPSCHATISTRLVHEASARTHIIAAILCLFICWPCVCLPYCMDSCQNANHYCPNCNAYLGTYKS